jgi:hypothetical protein
MQDRLKEEEKGKGRVSAKCVVPTVSSAVGQRT